MCSCPFATYFIVGEEEKTHAQRGKTAAKSEEDAKKQEAVAKS
jgi:hypothetical protein